MNFDLRPLSVLILLGCNAQKKPTADVTSTLMLSELQRAAAFAEADAWGDFWDGSTPLNDDLEMARISKRDLLMGPEEEHFNPKGSSRPADPTRTVVCGFDEGLGTPANIPGGRTAKFGCLPDDETKYFKVKYDPRLSVKQCARPLIHNVGPTAEIAATRLLWALGFKADRMYPARVVCRNCPPDPWAWLKKRANTYDIVDVATRWTCERFTDPTTTPDTRAERLFVPAAVEIKTKGAKIETAEVAGWGFNELFQEQFLSRNPAKRARQIVHREALVLLAAFLEHWDNKSENQRLACLDKKDERISDGCRKPFLILQDVGMVFGSGFTPLATMIAGKDPVFVANSIDFRGWRDTPTWAGDSRGCTVRVNSIPLYRSLNQMKISPLGANFLRNVLGQIGTNQIRDMFSVANIEWAPGGVLANRVLGVPGGATVEDWVVAFREKLGRDILNHRCGG